MQCHSALYSDPPPPPPPGGMEGLCYNCRHATVLLTGVWPSLHQRPWTQPWQPSCSIRGTWLSPPSSHLTPHPSHLTPHTSHLTSHPSPLTPHPSHLIPHTSHLTPHPLPQTIPTHNECHDNDPNLQQCRESGCHGLPRRHSSASLVPGLVESTRLLTSRDQFASNLFHFGVRHPGTADDSCNHLAPGFLHPKQLACSQEGCGCVYREGAVSYRSWLTGCACMPLHPQLQSAAGRRGDQL